MQTEYNIAAEQFLLKHGIKLRITLSDSKPAPWDTAGHHYRVTMSKAGFYKYPPNSGWCKDPRRLVFDFWGSAADMRAGKAPSAYDVLACISGDTHCPETFKDFCADFGESEDIIKALQTFKRCLSFSKRLRAFFTAEEIEALQEIN